MSDLYIKDVRFFEALSVLDKPISDATHSIPHIKFIITEIELNSGIIGQGYILSFHYSPNAIRGALKDIAEFVPSRFKVNETSKLNTAYARESEYFGRDGLLKWAVAGLNIAMWDAWAKYNKQPVWKMLGGVYQKIALYGSGGWLSYSDDELIDEITGYSKRGFPAVKIKVGSSVTGFDIQRLTKVREAVGKDMRIMMDANQGMDVSSAIELCHIAEKLDIYWFEEPIDHKNYQGYQQIKNQTSIMLAMGEREYDCSGLENLITLQAIDLWQPDIVRLGGVEGWLASADYANSHNVPLLPHFYKDYDTHLLCTVNNKIAVESFDWIDALIDNPLKIKDGYLYPHQQAGWGFNFLYDKMQPLEL